MELSETTGEQVRILTAKECARELREYNRWRRGKGRKYAQPGVPFNPAELGKVIDDAIVHLKAFPSVDEILAIKSVAATLPKDKARVVRKLERYISRVGRVDEPTQ